MAGDIDDVLDDVLDERNKTHGDYADVAETYMTLLQSWQGRNGLMPTQNLALTMIFMKIARILNGDPNHADHWIDIAGYARLAADHIDDGPDQTH